MPAVALQKVLTLFLIILAIPVIFLIWMTLTDFRPAGREILAEGPGGKISDSGLTLVTWNIGYAGLGREMDFFYDGGRRTRPYPGYYDKYKRGIMEYLSKIRETDLILLQEIDRNAKRSYFEDQMNWVGQALEGHHAYFAWNYKVSFVPVPLLRPLGRVMSGMATFSSYPACMAERAGFTRNFSWPRRLFMPDRCYIMTRFHLEGKEDRELVVINVHNSAFDDGTLRQEQIARLSEVMAGEYAKGHYVIAGGDWNINPPGFHPGLVETGDWADLAHGPFLNRNDFPAGWKWAVDPAVPTNRLLLEPYWKSRTPVTVIDFFIVSPNMEIIEVQTVDLGFENSDHHPVFLKVVFTE